MRHRSLLAVFFLTFAAVLAPARVSAQAPSDKETAHAVVKLYLDADKDMKAGDFVSACPKLARAVQLAPEAAIGARLTLAECHEKLGKLASAWREYMRASEVAARAGPEDPKKVEQHQEALKEAARLEPKLARLTLRLPVALRAIRDLGIQVDQLPVKEADWDKPLPVDKGEHTLTLSAAGYEERDVPVTVGDDGTRVDAPLPMLVATAALAGPSAAIPSASEPPAGSLGGRTSVAGFVLGGIGIAALAAGGALVGVAIGKIDENARIAPKDDNGEPICRTTPTSGENQTCATLRSNAEFAQGPGNVGIGILVGGGILVAAGALWLIIPVKRAMDPNSARLVPIVSREGGGMVLSGTF